ncbi:MAG: hypothetical protein JNIBNLAF_01809 [Nitrosomonas europaea]|nr:hypothetical protein [Nitrosomonas europaea]
MTLGNSTTTSYAYSTQSALATLTHNLTGTAQDQTYTYTRNQVQEITGQSWTNDSYQWTGYTNGTKSYTANGLNQYTAAAGATLTHDTKGNLTGDGVWTYTYDLDNQLISANKTGSTNSLAYDGAGRLRQTTLAGTVTGLTYDGVDLVAEYNSGGTLLRRYVHGPGVDEPLVWYEGTTTTNKTWLYQDQLGSVIGTANSAGTSTAIHSYGPYGEPNIATGIRFRYTGQQFLGSLNLYYYKARFYSPALGRFLQTDPIGTADDLNLYAYVGNNPINLTDPSGNCPMCIGAATSVVMGGVIRGLTGGDIFDPKAIALDATLGAVGAGIASKATAMFEAATASRLASQANQVHNVLDPIAQAQRTTAVLSTSRGTIVAGGARDLTPAQRSLAQNLGMDTAKLPGAHAEVTAIQQAQQQGAGLQALEVTRNICPSCVSFIESTGGKIVGERSAVWSTSSGTYSALGGGAAGGILGSSLK